MRRAERYVRGCLPVVLAGLLVAGCGDVRPGAAATVDGEAIALEDVDAVARALCTLELAAAEQQGAEPQALTTGEYRRQVLGTLVDAEVAEGAVARLDLDIPPSAYEQDLSEFDELFAELPTEEEAAVRDYVVVINRLQAALLAIGRETGGADIAERAALAQGQQELVEAANAADIELDPRFGELRRGQVVGGSGSLSVRGDGGADDDPPASQTCA